MYLGYQNNKIKFYTETTLNPTIYKVDRWEETQDEYILDGDEYILKDAQWEEKQRQKEKEEEKISIKSQLKELDEKRIRAICENEIKDSLYLIFFFFSSLFSLFTSSYIFGSIE